MFTIGCHLSSAKGYLHMAKDAVSIDANTFQFFTRNPRGGRAKAIDPKDIAAFAAYAPEHGIERILAHAPYTLNPASDKQQTRDFALMVLAEDLGRMEETPHQLYNMHPGSAVGQPCELAIAKIADALNQSLLPHQTTTLLLETMAGKGSEIGGTFEELAAIIAQVELESHVGVCLDTCHVWDAGYDIVGDLDCVLESGARHLTIYSIDSSDPGHGVSLLVEAGRVDAMITTHVGTNPLTNAKIQSGALKAEFNPMGTFIERIRCGGAGLGGVLTKTGLGTVVEEGKQIIEVNGESYLLETALRADIALTRCRRADPLGNLAYSGSSGHASHPVIATCGALSIVECDHFCDLGELGPDKIKVPGMFVDMILA